MTSRTEEQLKPLFEPTVKRPQNEGAKFLPLSILRDSFSITTWLLFGAVLQGTIVLLIPGFYALLPAVLLLAWRGVDTLLMTLGITKNRQMDGVILGKVSAQIPDTTGAFSTGVSNQEVTMIIIAARSNHPMGIFGPGFKEIGNYSRRMYKELADNAEHNGYLGQTSWLASGERETSNQVMTAVYFRTTEDVHNFAHGPLHRECWHWWNSITKSHPHLSIMHELYHVPKGHWENVFINNHRTGMAANYAPVTLESDRPQWISTLVDASKGRMKTHTGRIGTSDGADNGEFEHGQYSPVN